MNKIKKYSAVEDPKVLFENKNFFALFKPAGWCV